MASDPLSGDISPEYPLLTPAFSLSGGVVTASGATGAGASDHFYGVAGASYTVNVAAGADLSELHDNSTNTEVNGYVGVADTTTANTPNDEVIAIDSGTIVNRGTLNTYPIPPAPGVDNNYHKTSSVVFVGQSATLDNYGLIGDEATISSRTDPHYAYAQEDFAAIKIDGGSAPSVIVNEAGGVLEGYNAIFSGGGSGTINNFGQIYASNDCILSGFTIDNHAGAGLDSGVAGYASAHSYGNFINSGFVIGQDYGILAGGNNITIDDYAGAAVPGVTNFDGSPVYNGEISALIRGAETVVSTGSFQGNDAVLLQGSHQTLNLHSGVVDGVNYLPVILGPLVGGSNNGESNTLNLDFAGLTSSQASGLANAIANSSTVTSGATSYSGSYEVDSGHTYQWEDFSLVQFNPCFASGTLIGTACGEVAIECLRSGDFVRTVSGALRPLRWVGRRQVECGDAPNPVDLWPIRVAPGAFGQSRPTRALMLSRDHAVFIEGVLIPVWVLVNGTTIRPQPCVHVTYHHLALDRHDVLLAEGLPAESLLFADAYAGLDEAVLRLCSVKPPSATDWDGLGYAPLRIWGPEVERARALLARRARRGHGREPVGNRVAA